jgi:hypothetical protein
MAIETETLSLDLPALCTAFEPLGKESRGRMDDQTSRKPDEGGIKDQ